LISLLKQGVKLLLLRELAPDDRHLSSLRASGYVTNPSFNGYRTDWPVTARKNASRNRAKGQQETYPRFDHPES
jgi:hypothetical protein